MLQNTKKINLQQLKSICNIIGDTNRGLTKSEISTFLRQTNISILDNGPNKRDWLYGCLESEAKSNNSFEKVFEFICAALNPALYTQADNRDKYEYITEETNKVLALAGLNIDPSGKLIVVSPAQSLSEVDQRVNRLKKALYDRAIHSEVQRYCIKDYLREDYYDAVFESAKGLAERVRQITGLTTDGGALFQVAFSTSDPYLFFNGMKSDSERNEFIGLKELLEAIFHLVRNPAAHTPKINWKTDEVKALDTLTLISFAHKYLDECNKMPGK